MPAATYANTVLHVYWRGDAGREEHSIMHLLEKLADVDESLLQSSQMVDAMLNLIRACASDSCTYELTTQGSDYFGHQRPYDCEELEEFLLAGWEIPDAPAAIVRVLDSPEMLRNYRLILHRQVLEPRLFAREREGMRDALRWLSFLGDGRLLIITRGGG